MKHIKTTLLCIIIFLSMNGHSYTREYVIKLQSTPMHSFLKIITRLEERLQLKFLRNVLNSNYYLFQSNSSISKRSIHELDTGIKEIEWIEEQIPKKRVKRGFETKKPSKNQFIKMNLNDPLWSKQWYINSQSSMHIKEAWKASYTGKGVVISILDDGLERDHPDLIKNYDAQASTDLNDSDNDPRPRYDRYNYNKHGTRCAGEVAAMANNSKCSVGVAYNSKIGGIRMLDGEVTDLIEALALSFHRDYIDIYSASWGPDDDGKTLDGPDRLAQEALEEGVKKGRRGLGSIYVWASGNGGRESDNCNCDGYTNSIYTISISSASQFGNRPWYSESCSSTLACTFSSGATNEQQIVTTDLRKTCTEAHTGTSASAPLATGIISLTLEANSNLTWRDVQHIVIRAANPLNLTASDWIRNGAGRRVSHWFGFGMMDAMSMIKFAKNWSNVPEQINCSVNTIDSELPIYVPNDASVKLNIRTNGCQINYLEHVQATLSIHSNLRGSLAILLRSPMGTSTNLLHRRPNDHSTEGFVNWPFTTVHMWGENPNGKWILEIKNFGQNGVYGSV